MNSFSVQCGLLWNWKSEDSVTWGERNHAKYNIFSCSFRVFSSHFPLVSARVHLFTALSNDVSAYKISCCSWMTSENYYNEWQVQCKCVFSVVRFYEINWNAREHFLSLTIFKIFIITIWITDWGERHVHISSSRLKPRNQIESMSLALWYFEFLICSQKSDTSWTFNVRWNRELPRPKIYIFNSLLVNFDRCFSCNTPHLQVLCSANVGQQCQIRENNCMQMFAQRSNVIESHAQDDNIFCLNSTFVNARCRR